MEQLIMEMQAIKEVNKSLMNALKMITGFTFSTWLMVCAILIKSIFKKEE